ncbi:rhamnulose-1-phosphate aldolase [Telmatospirillum sp.]|uniref:rhamnulose-1-phosphate aldolase n=1 Tax=Telmatospirillum sp. TaxID=2079197 RepID=UPI00283DAA6D|nr:rhamnulose-1-phosphate aldolase [Telmatospirillum sp.]
MNMDIEKSWFVEAMAKATTDMWQKGWDERNGGNVSLRLLDDDVAPYLSGLSPEPRYLAMNEPLPELAGQYFLVTGTGKYFRNVGLDPAHNLGLIAVSADGKGISVLWGYRDGGGPTSELSAHFKSHIARQAVTDGRARVIMHCHATNLMSLSYVLELSSPVFTRALWEMSTECLVVFPDGIGVLPWLVPGTDGIGDRTAELMKRHPLVLWPFHGVFGTGATLDEAFGLIDTVEKSSEVLVKVLSMGGCRQSITTKNLIDLAKRFGVTAMPEALAVECWFRSESRR